MTDENQQATQLPNPTGWKLLCAIPEVEDKFSGTDLLKPDSMAKIEEHSTTVLFGALELWLRHPLKQDRTYWPYAERWLRDLRFNDELPAVPGQASRKIVGDF